MRDFFLSQCRGGHYNLYGCFISYEIIRYNVVYLFPSAIGSVFDDSVF